MQSGDLQALEKIARMTLYGIKDADIGIVFQVTDSRISQIKAMDAYKEMEAKIAAQLYTQNEEINRGWDGVENKAVASVLAHLNVNPEPDFALRAAAVANRAIRRGGNSHHTNMPINPQSAGARAIVHLNPVFVQKVQNNFQITKSDNKAEIQQKDSNFLPAKQVQDLLSLDSAGNKRAFDVSKPITNPMTESIDKDLQDLVIGTLID